KSSLSAMVVCRIHAEPVHEHNASQNNFHGKKNNQSGDSSLNRPVLLEKAKEFCDKYLSNENYKLPRMPWIPGDQDGLCDAGVTQISTGNSNDVSGHRQAWIDTFNRIIEPFIDVDTKKWREDISFRFISPDEEVKKDLESFEDKAVKSQA
ncbi:MAG: hypothetical protein HQL65_10095, partial [Magnetococcales bacterium]|nr:hypothetical protein [Magnetococcales bacterium]